MDMRTPMSLLPLRLDDVVFAAGARRIIDGVSLTHRRRAAHGDRRAQRRGQERAAAPLPRPARSRPSGSIVWNVARAAGRAAAAGDGVPAAGAAAALGARQRRRTRSASPACRADRPSGARARSAVARSASRRTPRIAGARALRRRAAAPRAGPRLGAASRDPFPRRADGEPRSGRDARDRERDRRRCIAAGTKIVMVTHNLGQARRLGDEILFLHQGRLAERAPRRPFLQAAGSRVEAAQFLEGELPW